MLDQEEAVLLEQSRWKTVPWALEPASKNAMTCVQDVLCDIPGLMEDAVNLRNRDREAVQKSISHQALSRSIVDCLNHLYQCDGMKNTQNTSEEIPARQPLDEQPLFPKMLHFSSIKRANEIILYSTALIFILRLGAEAIGPTFDTSTAALNLPPFDTQGPLYLPGQAINIQAIATEISKSVGYYLSDYCHRAGVSLPIPLRVAHVAFLSTSRQEKWVDRMIIRIAELNGFEISENNKKVNPDTLNLLSMTG